MSAMSSNWVSVSDAHLLTGISLEALRKACTRGRPYRVRKNERGHWEIDSNDPLIVRAMEQREREALLENEVATLREKNQFLRETIEHRDERIRQLEETVERLRDSLDRERNDHDVIIQRTARYVGSEIARAIARQR